MSRFIDKALMTHAQIKRRICAAIRDPDTVDAEGLRSDRDCVFGQWIYGPQSLRDVGGGGQHDRIRDAHRQFHEAAYQAARAAQLGRMADAEASLSTGDFEMASRTMTEVLVELKTAKSTIQV